MKTVLLLALHGLCLWAEYVLWHQPFNMPVPVFISVIGLLWLIVIVLSYFHALHILAWMNAPSPDLAELIRQDDDRRKLEMNRLSSANPWVDQ